MNKQIKKMKITQKKKLIITAEFSSIDLERSMNFIKRFLQKMQLCNLCLAEILSIIRLSNLKRSIDVTSLEEVTNIKVLLPKPMADKMY